MASQRQRSEERFKLFLLKPKVRELVFKYRKKWNIPSSGFENREDELDWYSALVNENNVYKYRKGVKSFLTSKELNLSPYYYVAMEDYLMHNNTEGFLPIDNLNIYKKIEKSGMERLFIEIYSETTTKDIQRAFYMIKSWQKQMPGYKTRRRNMDNLEMSENISKLHSEGKKDKEIVPIVKEKLGTSTLLTENVSKKYSRFNKKIKDA